MSAIEIRDEIIDLLPELIAAALAELGPANTLTLERGTVVDNAVDVGVVSVALDVDDESADPVLVQTLIDLSIGDRVAALMDKNGTALIVGGSSAGTPGSGAPFVHLAGDTMTGPLILSGDATDPLGAVTKEQLDAITAGVGTVLVASAAIPRFQCTKDFPVYYPSYIDSLGAPIGQRPLQYLTIMQKNLPHFALPPIGGAPLRARLTAVIDSTTGAAVNLAIYENTFDDVSTNQNLQLTPGGTLTATDDFSAGTMHDTAWVDLTLLDAHTTRNSVVGIVAWTTDPEQAFTVAATLKIALR